MSVLYISTNSNNRAAVATAPYVAGTIVTVADGDEGKGRNPAGSSSATTT
jgi:hypothetical protein